MRKRANGWIEWWLPAAWGGGRVPGILEIDIVHIRRSALVPFPADVMFDIVDTPEDYPLFLPWCANAVLRERNSVVTSAEIVIAFKGLNIRFTTRNPKSRPDYMLIHLVEGPFSQFTGEWRFRQLAPRACQIDFSMSYQFRSAIVGAVSARVFTRIADTLVDAFVERARVLTQQAPGDATG
jgi:ribosome-associated toxin RatA of RatAB toxin-antitoxin module